MNRKVMFVDDDPMLLNSTRRQLVTKLAGCDLVFCKSGAEALIEVAKSAPDMIISDVRMPEMDGPELLRRIAEQHPETVRIGWTGQSEAEQLQRILKVAHQVLGKPCATETLRDRIEGILRFRGRIHHPWLLRKLTHADQLRCDYSRLIAILNLLDDPQASAPSVAAKIDESPTTRAKLLGLANSSFFAPSSVIANTVDAIMLVGFDLVKAIFISNEMAAAAVDSPVVTAELNHCVARGTDAAVRMRRLGLLDRLDEDEKNAALIAAMFHQFGRVQFALHAERDYAEMRQRSAQAGGDLDQLEKEHFGASQGEVAAYLLCVWGIDTRACDAIARQNDPSGDESPVTCSLRAVTPSEVTAEPAASV